MGVEVQEPKRLGGTSWEPAAPGWRLGASGTAVAAEGFYHLLGEMDCLALGTGAGDGPLTFAVSDGQRLSLYSLQMPSRYCA